MKIPTLTVAIALVSTLASAALTGASDAVAESASSKLRRAADALDDLLDNHEDLIESMARDPACYAEDGDCTLARREAVELAAAVAEARAAANPAAAVAAQENTPEGWCDAPGEYCDRTKRAMEMRRKVQKRSGDDDSYDEEYMRINCHRPGNDCHEVRRRAEWGARGKGTQDFLKKMMGTLFKGTQNPTNFDLHSGYVDVPSTCAGIGQACIKLKRAEDLILDLAASEPGFDNEYAMEHTESPSGNEIEARGADGGDKKADSHALIRLGKLVAQRRAMLESKDDNSAAAV